MEHINTLSKEEKELYDSWDKEQIYEAYVAEHRIRLGLNKELNKERLKNKEIAHILKNIVKNL